MDLATASARFSAPGSSIGTSPGRATASKGPYSATAITLGGILLTRAPLHRLP